MSSARLVLTAVEFEVLWEWLRLGPTPAALRLDSPCRTHAERARIVLGGWQGMRERGLADVVGPSPALVCVLGVLAAPVESVELRMWIGRNVRAMAAERNGVHVIAERQDETVAIHRTADLAAGLAALLADVPLVPGPPRIAAADHPPLRRHGTHGQISALAADRRGVLRRLPAVLALTRPVNADAADSRPSRARGRRDDVAEAIQNHLAAARSAAAQADLAG